MSRRRVRKNRVILQLSLQLDSFYCVHITLDHIAIIQYNWSRPHLPGNFSYLLSYLYNNNCPKCHQFYLSTQFLSFFSNFKKLTKSMASSSSFASDSQYCPRWKYDVFLSFRGADTRRTFTGHLYEGLKSRGIFTFLDDKRLEDGDSISEELLKAIEESQVKLIVFSRNYATSRWCLNEIVKIMECKGEENGQIVIPIFYDVDPSHVRYQSDSFAEAFAKHESRYKDDVEGMQKVQGWRTALTAAANLKGYDIRDGIESEKIQQIIDHISSKFCKSARFLSYLQDVVGIHAHLEELKSLLQIEINDVRIVGIWGIGGIGKTTIAKAIFDTLSHQFKAACFLGNVKENAKKNQLHSLQNTLLSELLRKKDDYVNDEYVGKCMIQSRLCSMKVLIVLDDIDHGDHLEYLAGDVGWFGNGSRVVVTTRNRKLIENNDAIYEMHTLPDHEAMQLFNQHAFKKEVPDECFRKFSLEVVDYAKGLPLALKVWGSTLHKKGVDKWKKIVDKIKKKSNSEIVEKLKISYDGLEPEEQKIFLDIACFFCRYERKEVMQIVESYDSGAEYILDVLIDKSLVFISEYDSVEMHDLIEDMGKYIVKMQKDSGKPSRVWNVVDFEDVTMDNMQFLSLRRIDLSHSNSLNRTPDFEGMPNLEYLNLEECRSLEEVHHSLKYCKKLIHLNLSYCTSLERIPYVNVESLESLNLKYCSSLEKFPEILGIREPPLSFFDLHLNGMKNLVSLPSSICKSKGLVKLSVSKCSKLESLPEEIGDLENLEELDARDTLISRPPSSIVWLNKLKSLSFGQPRSADGVFFVFPQVNKGLLSLKSLDLSYCNMIDGGLPKDIGSLSSLKHLNLSYCNIIDGGLPEDIGSLSSLEDLCLKGNNFEHLPRSIAQLCSLRFLDLTDCKRLTQLPEDIGCLSSLKELYLSGNNFEHLPQSISELGALRSLNLSDCKRLTQLPEFQQQLDIIDAVWSNASICNSLFQNISSLQHDICSSDSLSLRVFGSWVEDIPSWFNYQEMFPSVSVNLPENWYEPDKFLGFAVCYYGEYYIDCITAHLIPLCDDGMSSMTHDFALSNNLEVEAIDEINIYFFLIPLGGLWDASNANEKTPNDYGCIKLDVFGETDDDIGETDDDIGKTYDDFGETDDDFGKFGVRLLYKDEVELHFGIRKSR